MTYYSIHHLDTISNIVSSSKKLFDSVEDARRELNFMIIDFVYIKFKIVPDDEYLFILNPNKTQNVENLIDFIKVENVNPDSPRKMILDLSKHKQLHFYKSDTCIDIHTNTTKVGYVYSTGLDQKISKFFITTHFLETKKVDGRIVNCNVGTSSTNGGDYIVHRPSSINSLSEKVKVFIGNSEEKNAFETYKVNFLDELTQTLEKRNLLKI